MITRPWITCWPRSSRNGRMVSAADLERVPERDEVCERPLEDRIVLLVEPDDLPLQLVADVESNRPDRREITHTGAEAVAQIAKANRGVGEDISGVDEDGSSDAAENRETILRVGHEDTLASDRRY